MAVCTAATLSLTLNAASRNVSYAIEDAAFQTVTRLNTDARTTKSIGRIAFVKLWLPTPGESFKLDSSDSQVFEAENDNGSVIFVTSCESCGCVDAVYTVK